MRRPIVLGLLQGPTEMAPVSSSAHTALLGGLCNRRQAGDGRRAMRLGGRAPQAQEAAFAKSFEVALHGGTACALTLAMGGSLRGALARLAMEPGSRAGRRRLSTLALSLAPPALAGALLERPIERRLGGPRSIAAGLALGAVAMALADRRAGTRTVAQAGPADGLALGLAQTLALAPGVSRRGATLTAARLRGFGSREADELSWLVALPVIAGACALKSRRLAGGGLLAAEQRRELAEGALAAFASTLAVARLGAFARLRQASLSPFCVYRLALALLVLACPRP